MAKKYPKVFSPCLQAGTLLVGLMSGYYQRAFAGTCGGAAGVYNCDGAAVPSDLTVSINIGQPLSVTTLPGFGIDTHLTGGDAFSFESSGDLTITDTHSSTIIGETNGIDAINSGIGDLSITTNGVVTGTNGYGIVAENSLAGNDLTISSVDVTGGRGGIHAYNNGGGCLRITTSGEVRGGWFGIAAYNDGGGPLVITTSGDVLGGDIGIMAGNYGDGPLTITTSGDVLGGFFGISAGNFGDGPLTITTSGEVLGGYDGIVAVNSGSGPLTITTSGEVLGGYDGIYALNNGSGPLTITTSGEVRGGYDGIVAVNSGSGPLTITTSGEVRGYSDGIVAVNYGSGSATINISSSGIVEGGRAGIYVYSDYGQSSTINVNGQVRNLSGSPADLAIGVVGGPTSVNLNVGSQTTGTIDLSSYNDTVRLAGSLNGSISMNNGNDTFIRVGGSSMSGTADGGNGSDTLGFNNMGVVNGSLLGTKYLSFENLGIFGGSNTLTGIWDFSQGNTTVYAGSLMVDGVLSTRELYVNQGGYMSIPGTVNSSSALVDGSMNLTGSLQTGILSVGPTGFLSGTGVVNGSVVNYGTISPGNSIGTLNVNGSLSFMPGSTYITELAVNGSSDLLRVNGPVTISGGRLQASLPRALYPNGRSWQIINASGGVNGRFSSVNTNFTSSTIRLQQSVYGGILALVIDRTPYAQFGDTANKVALGSALDTLLPAARGSMASLLTSMDFDMNPAQIRATLHGLNPDMYTVFPAAGLETATIFGQTVSQRQQEIRVKEAFPAEDRKVLNWNVWGRVLGSRLDRDTTEEMVGYNLDTGGVVFGVDRSFGPVSRAGLLLGYSDGSFDWDEPGNSGQITGKHMGFYGSTNYEGFYLDGLVGYTSVENSSERLISTPLFFGSGAATFDASTWSSSLTGGYDFAFGSVTLGPVASINYLYLDQDGFSENGTTAFSQKVQASDADSLSSNLGLQLGGLIESGAWRLLPRGSLGWLHQFKDDGVMLNSSFVDYPTATFSMTGVDPVTDQLAFTIGLSAEYGANLSIYADYSIIGSDEQTAQSLSCGLSWLF